MTFFRLYTTPRPRPQPRVTNATYTPPTGKPRPCKVLNVKGGCAYILVQGRGPVVAVDARRVETDTHKVATT